MGTAVSRGPRIIVVGAGIVGAAVACYLARQGARVVIVDAAGPAAATTAASLGWINASTAETHAYFHLRLAAIDEYRRLGGEPGGLPSLRWAGSLAWDAPPDYLALQARRLSEWGYRARLVDGNEVQRIEPACREPPELALWCEEEASLDPVAGTLSFLNRAGAAGAQRNFSYRVERLLCSGTRVIGVEAAYERMDADIVVVAAGARTAALCAPLGIAVPLEISSSLVVQAAVRHRGLGAILSAPHVRILEDGAGTLRVVGDAPRDTGTPFALEVEGRDLLGRAASLLSKEVDAAFRTARIGVRHVPPDGLPVIGFAPGIEGLYLAVMHSGVTLAPVAGRLVAEELLGEGESALLGGFRPARFR